MLKKRWIMPLFLIVLLFTLTYYMRLNNRAINYTINDGRFSESKSDIITIKYRDISKNGFIVSIDFNITGGKVDWQIVDSNDELIYEGYSVYENGKTYSQLIYPRINKKVARIRTEDFGILPISSNEAGRIYKLKLKSLNAEGSYIVKWSDKLHRK